MVHCHFALFLKRNTIDFVWLSVSCDIRHSWYEADYYAYLWRLLFCIVGPISLEQRRARFSPLSCLKSQLSHPLISGNAQKVLRIFAPECLGVYNVFLEPGALEVGMGVALWIVWSKTSCTPKRHNSWTCLWLQLWWILFHIPACGSTGARFSDPY